jgi:hypothetical protein
MLAPALALLYLAAHCHGQGTLTVTFDGQPPGSYTSPVGSYSESGVVFTGVQGNGLAFVGAGLSGYPDNGTGYLQLPGGAGLTFSFTPLRAFDLISFDAAESVAALPGPVSFRVVGYVSHGQGLTVTNAFTTDGINDGTGPLVDFQTFTLDSRFQNIYRVDILGSPFSIDNVMIGAVPEPSAGALVLVGTLCGLGWRWGKGKRAARGGPAAGA